LSTAELIAVVLAAGSRGSSALGLGEQVLGRFGLGGLVHASLEELKAVPGLGQARALQLKAAFELGRRLAFVPTVDRPRIGGPIDVSSLLGPEMIELEQEHLRILLLNVKNDLLAVHEVYKGCLNSSPVRVAEVFREPIRRNCAAVILVHNHPSGDPTPSAADAQVTRQLVDAGRLLDIGVLDHVILARHGWVSLRERGLGFG
jgi:DNA repair protein RadC